MKKFILKISLLFLLLASWITPSTGAEFFDNEASSQNTFSAGCWAAPSVPVLSYPANNTYAGITSAWNINPYMDWNNSTSPCPMGGAITYQYESYRDAGLTQLAYQSVWLSNSMIPASGTPEGSYYWRVRAKDSQGYISNFSLPWLLVVDRTPPTIIDVVNLIATPEEENDTKATVSWNTDENADSNLYWSDDNISWNPISDPTFVTNHNLEILGLLTDTTYYYYITNSDLAGNTTTSSIYSFSTGGMDPEDFTPTTDIVINEFLPNPTGDDFALYPKGEWVELYNRGTVTKDMTGWSIGAYNTPSDRLPLNFGVNTFSSDGVNDKWLSPGEFMVVYRNGDTTFYLKNSAADRIRLFNKSGTRVDRYMYTASQVFENKSIARYPDGSDTWFDPIPSPLGANVLESWQLNQPEINYTFDGQKIFFEITNTEKFKKLEYQITYNSDFGKQGVLGETELNNQTIYKNNKIFFGTCSSGGTCIYHTNPSNVLLKIILTNDSEIVNLEKIIN